ncbi:efflux RND transporter periplasmic adaptor subunit [Pararhodospirillum photometricum]|nr:efflux RND transporter periplasmic adaptor subunit [Pararhodospirillum photometricum]
MTRMGQVLLSLLMVAAVGGGMVGWNTVGPAAPPGGSKAPGAPLVQVVSVARQPVQDLIEAVGTTRAQAAIDIRPLGSGRLVEVAFSPGAAVAAGAVLARLDDETERADLREAEATVVQATQALDRARRLRATQALAQVSLDDAQARAQAAQAGVERARKALAERVIRAPFAGVVGFRELDEGARVSAGDLLTTLDDLSVVEITFAVPERHYGLLRVDQRVEATTPAFPGRVFAGTVMHIDTRVGETSRAFRVRASLPNPERLLPAGLSVNVSVEVAAREALMVPEGAVIAEAGGGAVYVLDGDRVRRRSVRLGLRRAETVEIVEGLSAGDTVVAQGLQRLRDGSAVRLR